MNVLCDRCRCELAPGAVRYAARLRLCGDTGGSAPQLHGAELSRELRSARRAVAELTERELMEDVVEEFSFVLCPDCRRLLRADPAGAANVAIRRPGVPQ